MHQNYVAIKKLIDNNSLDSFQDIFLHIPIFLVAYDCGIAKNTLDHWIKHPENIEAGFIFKLSQLLECDPFFLCDLVCTNSKQLGELRNELQEIMKKR